MAKLDGLDPGFRKRIETELLPNLERATGLKWGIPQAKRSLAYQHGLFMQPTDGKDNDGDGLIDEKDEKVTCADAGQSPHNFGFAVDVCPIKNGDFWWECPDKYWKMLCELAEGMGFVSGRNFHSIKDNPHVEDPQWKLAKAGWVKNGRPLV